MKYSDYNIDIILQRFPIGKYLKKGNTMKNIAIFISGKGSNLKYLINNLSKEIKILLVFSNKEDADGLKYGIEKGIKTIAIDTKKFSSPSSMAGELKRLLGNSIDLIVLAGYMEKIPSELVEKYNIVNLHPSLLPKHKGLKAIERSFNDQTNSMGITYHLIDNEIDSGEIILQLSFLKQKSLKENEILIKRIEHKSYFILIEYLLGVISLIEFNEKIVELVNAFKDFHLKASFNQPKSIE